MINICNSWSLNDILFDVSELNFHFFETQQTPMGDIILSKLNFDENNDY